jgi:hypothetical protein
MSTDFGFARTTFGTCLLLLSSTSCAPQGVDQEANVRGADSVAVNRLQQLEVERAAVQARNGFGDAKLDALFDEAINVFADESLDAWRSDSPLLVTRERWLARLQRCAGIACRRSILDEVGRRLIFGLGRSRDAFVGIPWRVGKFRNPAGQDFRAMNVLPLERGQIVVSIETLSFAPDRHCELIAAGEVDANGNGVLELVGDEPGRFTLRTLSPAELIVEPVQPYPGIITNDIQELAAGPCNGSYMGAYKAITAGPR